MCRYDRPVLFYVLSCLIPWAFWAVAAYLSHLPLQSTIVRSGTSAMGLLGLFAPVAVMLWLLRGEPGLLADVVRRLTWPRRARAVHLACAFGLLLASVLAATALSLPFGYSPDQFLLRGGFTFTSGLLPAWVMLLAAPFAEELAWHGYGTDALASRMRLFSASMAFVLFWAIWHLPLAFIKGYYHSEVVAGGWLHAVNFPVSMIPYVIVMNWLYYRTGRNITVTIIFHITAGFVNEIFMTHPDTKIIQTALLLVLAGFVLARNRELFFARPQVRGGDAVAQERNG